MLLLFLEANLREFVTEIMSTGELRLRLMVVDLLGKQLLSSCFISGLIFCVGGRARRFIEDESLHERQRQVAESYGPRKRITQSGKVAIEVYYRVLLGL